MRHLVQNRSSASLAIESIRGAAVDIAFRKGDSSDIFHRPDQEVGDDNLIIFRKGVGNVEVVTVMGQT